MANAGSSVSSSSGALAMPFGANEGAVRNAAVVVDCGPVLLAISCRADFAGMGCGLDDEIEQVTPSGVEVRRSASLRIADGVAQLAGSPTAPAHRRRGIQTALLAARRGPPTRTPLLLGSQRGGCP